MSKQNMGSSSKTTNFLNYPIVKQHNLESLRKCADLLPPIPRGSFDLAYGNMRMLLQLEVKTEAIAALSQFYDSSLRCFTFKDFQLAPTLEEYAHILGFSLENVKPYQYLGDYYNEKDLCSLLNIKKDKLLMNRQNRNHVVGFPQKYFEKLMNDFALAKNWKPLQEVLALTIFGVVLFPHIEGYIDTTAINIFLAFKKGKSPVPALLADTYSTFTYHQQRKGNKIYCCLPMLYVWLLNHVFVHSIKVRNPIQYARCCEVKNMSTKGWMQMLVNLTELNINWFPSWWIGKPDVICQCGRFQNVPLMGSRGCINYNPSLVLRQLGYRMRNPPTDEMVAPFYIYSGDPKNTDMVIQITEAWDKVISKGQELRKRNDHTKATFRDWLQERIQNTRLPHQSVTWVREEMHESVLSTVRQLEDFKVDEEKKNLQEGLDKALLEIQRLKEENGLKEETMRNSNKRLREEEDNRKQIQKYLKGANDEIERLNRKMNEDVGSWKIRWEDAVDAEKCLRSRLGQTKRESQLTIANLQDEIFNKDEALRVYKQALENEQRNNEELRDFSEYQKDVYNQLEVDCIKWETFCLELKDETLYWKDKFSKLAWLSDQALIGIPPRLSKAEASMNPLNTPNEVTEFVEFCKVIVEDIKIMASHQPEKKKKDGKMKAICN